MNVNDLLKFTSSIGYSVRKIDTIIHRWKDDHTPNLNIEYDIEAHINHQYDMMSFTYGFEREIFNDSKVYNGKTGPMTDVLRACFFILYNDLLTKGIEINVQKDYGILVSLLSGIKYDDEQDKMIIPDEEFNAIREIILRFKSLRPDLYDDKWWNEITNSLIEAHNSLNSWEWWENNPEKRTFQMIESRMKKIRLPNHGIWEYHPCYIDYYLGNWSLELEFNLKKLNYLKSLFDNPFSKTNIDIRKCKSDEMFKNKYLKYKQKYNTLKNNLLKQ